MFLALQRAAVYDRTGWHSCVWPRPCIWLTAKLRLVWAQGRQLSPALVVLVVRQTVVFAGPSLAGGEVCEWCEEVVSSWYLWRHSHGSSSRCRSWPRPHADIGSLSSFLDTGRSEGRARSRQGRRGSGRRRSQIPAEEMAICQFFSLPSFHLWSPNCLLGFVMYLV